MSRTPFENQDDVTDAPESGEPTETGRESVLEDFTKLQAERDDLFNRLARATADFQNTRKRLEADAEQRLQFANASLIKSLLPVIDNFERGLAVDAANSDAAGILKGMQIVHDQLLAVLRQQQVEEIAPQPGEAFDPSRHEALMQQPTTDFPANSVTQVLQKGYALQERVLRPAQVAVAKEA
jgi:molecular chaperone GrpE